MRASFSSWCDEYYNLKMLLIGELLRSKAILERRQAAVKTQKFLEIIVLLHSHSQRFFANVSLKFSNIKNRRVTSAHVAIFLSSLQLIEEYLLATKRF